MKTPRSRVQQAESTPPHVAQRFSTVGSASSGALRNPLTPATPTLAAAGGCHEQEADRIAAQVMRGPTVAASQPPQTHQQAPAAANADTRLAIIAAQRAGSPLPSEIRKQFEPRFGHDFGAVRIHADRAAAHAARSIQASAYTIGDDIVFGAGKYAPAAESGRRLIAHELAHVVQQRQGGVAIARKVELRPPGKREYSAYHRRGELLDRLNAQSSAIQYSLNGRALECTVIDEAALSEFDRQMRTLLSEDVQLIPMRLITKEGRDREHKAGKVNKKGPYKPVFLDTFVSGYVDLDDLLATDDTSFKLSLIHVLAERAGVPNYARRIGTSFADGEFKQAHGATRARDDPAILQDILGDPTLTLATSGEDTSDAADKRLIFRYESARGYAVVRIYHHIDGDLSSGETFVETADGARSSIEEFVKSGGAASR